jgi:hypothetical protein
MDEMSTHYFKRELQWIVVGSYYDDEWDHVIEVYNFADENAAKIKENELYRKYEEEDRGSWSVDCKNVNNDKFKLIYDKNYNTMSIKN